MQYRREIDGLRAIAVLPVVLFHAGFNTFSGGFIGVDVFFVISGYLITSIILEEKAARTFTLAHFYERRARRILPALFFVILITIPFAWLWLLPSDFKIFGKSLLAVSLFSSNILFWQESGYFDPAAELKPLLHTWSLAVEEQYYLLFPLLVLIMWRVGKKWLVALLVAGTIVSLAMAEWGSVRHPTSTFYLLHTRSWELALGALTALYLEHKGHPLTKSTAPQLLSCIGLAMVAVAIAAFGKSTPFPSAYALLPTVGTTLIILFGTPDTIVGRLLGWKPLVGIGLISYSIYLWHQPIFALARHRSLEELHWSMFVWLTLLAISMAYLTWLFIELPFRRMKSLAVPGIAASGTALLIGALIYINNGFAGRMPRNIEWRDLGEKIRSVGYVCTPSASADSPGVEYCNFGDTTSTRVVALYGDSHADAIHYQVDEQFKKSHIRGIRIRAAGCEVVPRVFTAMSAHDARECRESYYRLLKFISAQTEAVIIVSRWTFRLFPIEGSIDELPFDNLEGGRELETYREYLASDSSGAVSKDGPAKRSAIEHLLSTMTGTSKSIILVYPVPELGWDIARVKFFEPQRTISTSYDIYKARNRFILDSFENYHAPNIIKIKPADIFCSELTGRCISEARSTLLYYDDDHLSDAGAKLLVDNIMHRLR